MGSGKSTIGKLLAKKLNVQFIDTDEVLESRTGVSVSTIFEIEGEQGFRERESKLIKELQSSKESVIATGGGAILDPVNRHSLNQTGFVVYLKAELSVLYERLKGGRSRPLLNVGNLKQKLEMILNDRETIYLECADTTIETGVISADKMVDEIIKAAASFNKES